MSLIEEIEAAANTYSRANDTDKGECAYLLMVNAEWWPRIKAALEAAQEMDEACVGRDHYMPASIESLARAQRKFRAAFVTGTPQPQPPTAPDTPA